MKYSKGKIRWYSQHSQCGYVRTNDGVSHYFNDSILTSAMGEILLEKGREVLIKIAEDPHHVEIDEIFLKI